jgi:hypothetical protein
LNRWNKKESGKNRSSGWISAPVAMTGPSSRTGEKEGPEDSCHLLGLFDLDVDPRILTAHLERSILTGATESQSRHEHESIECLRTIP